MSHHLDKYKEQNPPLVDLVKQSLYVDDFVTGANSEQEALHIYTESKGMLHEGGFNLCKWKSNSREVMDQINRSENIAEKNTTTTTESCGNSEDNIKILGVSWNTTEDKLSFNLSELISYAKTLTITKRSLLKMSAKIFDPLGLLSPFVIRLFLS